MCRVGGVGIFTPSPSFFLRSFRSDKFSGYGWQLLFQEGFFTFIMPLPWGHCYTNWGCVVTCPMLWLVGEKYPFGKLAGRRMHWRSASGPLVRKERWHKASWEWMPTMDQLQWRSHSEVGTVVVIVVPVVNCPILKEDIHPIGVRRNKLLCT